MPNWWPMTKEGAERLQRYLGRTWSGFVIAGAVGIGIGKLLVLYLAYVVAIRICIETTKVIDFKTFNTIRCLYIILYYVSIIFKG
jgi:hypothetical protein